MRKWIGVLVIALVVGVAGWGQTANTLGTGQWLHDLSQGFQKSQNTTTSSITTAADAREYMGHVEGAAQVMWDNSWLELKGTTLGQWYEVVGKYLDAHPETWNVGADAQVYRALVAPWPGPKKPGP